MSFFSMSVPVSLPWTMMVHDNVGNGTFHIYISGGQTRKKNHIERKSLMLATSGGKICFHGRSADPGNIPFQFQSTLILAYRFKNMFFDCSSSFLVFSVCKFETELSLNVSSVFSMLTTSNNIRFYCALPPCTQVARPLSVGNK